MENAEEIFHFLEEFSKRKPKTIPHELNEYLAYVARTGDPVYQWSLVKCLFKEKLLSVITDFYETPGLEIPPYPNVDPFHYDIMKNSLLERLDSFTAAPFTVQRICELLTYPRKQYNRVDKYMRAIEKNILVVSTREPGIQRHPEPENGEVGEPIVNGSDNNSEYNVDVEMEDMSWKENTDQHQNPEPQPGSSDAHISVGEIEARLKVKQEMHMNTQEKTLTHNHYESVTPPELASSDVTQVIVPPSEETIPPSSTPKEDTIVSESISAPTEEVKLESDIPTKTEMPSALVIPEIKVDNVEMTEQRLNKELNDSEKTQDDEKHSDNETATLETKTMTPPDTPENSSNEPKEESESKLIPDALTSEESSSSSDITDGNSNSPKTAETPLDAQEEANQCDTHKESLPIAEECTKTQDKSEEVNDIAEITKVTIESDNYSISDVNSELPQPPAVEITKKDDTPVEKLKEEVSTEVKNDEPEAKVNNTEISDNKEP